MGLFRKKSDPVAERAKLLDEQIAALEAEISKLNAQQEKAAVGPSPFAAQSLPDRSVPAQPPSPPTPVVAPGPVLAQPRLRSTARPHHQAPAPAPANGEELPSAVTAPAPAAAQEPIFEEDQDRLQAQPETSTSAHYNELGVRKYDLTSAWRRLKNQFRGPVTSNPKLVHYLSAGSIQGLRPLRYEKRVARNRVIVLAAFLVLALWGIIAIVMGRH
jgi:hypothetical protein